MLIGLLSGCKEAQPQTHYCREIKATHYAKVWTSDRSDWVWSPITECVCWVKLTDVEATCDPNVKTEP